MWWTTLVNLDPEAEPVEHLWKINIIFFGCFLDTHSAEQNGDNYLQISIIQVHSTELNNFDILQLKSDEVCEVHVVAWFITLRGILLRNDSQ